MRYFCINCLAIQREAVEALIQDLPKFRLKAVPTDCSECPICLEEFRVGNEVNYLCKIAIVLIRCHYLVSSMFRASAYISTLAMFVLSPHSPWKYILYYYNPVKVLNNIEVKH